jgi:NAD-dependent deacetylase
MDAIAQARDLIQRARSVGVLTGAGVSAESGVPTFRGDGGLWRNYKPEDLATPEAFLADPTLVWSWYDWRRQQIAKAEPNPGHRALVELELRVERFTLITQNVDGLHERAGSRNTQRLHGEIWMLRCVACGREIRDLRAPLPELPPRCACGGLQRPGVVWFGESLPVRPWHAAVEAAGSADVLLVAGTSAQVYPAAGLIDIARRAGTAVVEVNLEPTAYSQAATLSLRGKTGEILPRIICG